MAIIIIIRWIMEARQKRKTRDTAERTSGAEDAVKLPFAVDQAPETEDAAKLPYAVKLKEDYSGIPAGTAGTVITELTEDYFEVEFHGINGSEVSSWPVPGRLLERAGND